MLLSHNNPKPKENMRKASSIHAGVYAYLLTVYTA